jgi:hypothetical protein
MQFDCGTRILRVIHGRDGRGTFKAAYRVTESRLKAELRTSLHLARLVPCVAL